VTSGTLFSIWRAVGCVDARAADVVCVVTAANADDLGLNEA